jgi:hypothetical protein
MTLTGLLLWFGKHACTATVEDPRRLGLIIRIYDKRLPKEVIRWPKHAVLVPVCI